MTGTPQGNNRPFPNEQLKKQGYQIGRYPQNFRGVIQAILDTNCCNGTQQQAAPMNGDFVEFVANARLLPPVPAAGKTYYIQDTGQIAVAQQPPQGGYQYHNIHNVQVYINPTAPVGSNRPNNPVSPKDSITFVTEQDKQSIWVSDGAQWNKVFECKPAKDDLRVLTTAGDTPQANTLTTPLNPTTDKFVFNPVDQLLWVYDDNSNRYVLATSPQVDDVRIIAVASETPQINTLNVPLDPATDKFVFNSVDQKLWVHDGANYVLAAEPQVEDLHILTTAGEDPTTPAVLTTLDPAKDKFVFNSVDQLLWIHDGTHYVLATSSQSEDIFLLANAGETPATPGLAVTPDPALPANRYVFNTVDGKLWISDGTQYVPISSGVSSIFDLDDVDPRPAPGGQYGPQDPGIYNMQMLMWSTPKQSWELTDRPPIHYICFEAKKFDDAKCTADKALYYRDDSSVMNPGDAQNNFGMPDATHPNPSVWGIVAGDTYHNPTMLEHRFF